MCATLSGIVGDDTEGKNESFVIVLYEKDASSPQSLRPW